MGRSGRFGDVMMMLGRCGSECLECQRIRAFLPFERWYRQSELWKNSQANTSRTPV